MRGKAPFKKGDFVTLRASVSKSSAFEVVSVSSDLRSSWGDMWEVKLKRQAPAPTVNLLNRLARDYRLLSPLELLAQQA